jgi:hypothetical protein
MQATTCKIEQSTSTTENLVGTLLELNAKAPKIQAFLITVMLDNNDVEVHASGSMTQMMSMTISAIDATDRLRAKAQEMDEKGEGDEATA